MGNRLKTEQEHHKQAFEHYDAQTGRRSYKVTAQAFGVSVSAVKTWSRSFRWQQRLSERSAQTARETADRYLKAGAPESERNLKIVRMALLQLAKDISERRIKGQISDVDRLIRLEEHLKGIDSRACRDPAHKAMVRVQYEDDPEVLKEHWLEMTFRSLDIMPEMADRLSNELKRYQKRTNTAGTAPDVIN